jgi:hypothetical protein
MTKKVTQSTKTRAERKVKAGTREMVNPKTGEVEKVPVYEIKEYDINFEKIWLGHLLTAMDCLGGKRKEVVKWILANRNQDNQIVATVDFIKEECGVSKQTVVTVMKAMQDSNLLHRIRNGLYTLDTDFIFSGKSDDRMNIMFTYEKLKDEKNNK